MIAIWRIEVVKNHTGYKSRASIYNNIRDGLWTKAVPIGLRSVGWPSNEVEAINAYRIAGATDDQIRELVQRLHAKRSEGFEQIEATLKARVERAKQEKAA